MNKDNAEVVVASATSQQGGPRSAQTKRPAANSSKTAEAWLFFSVVRKRWGWMFLGALLFAAAGFAGTWHLWKKNFTASAQLIRTDSPRTAQVFNYQTLTPQTFAGLLRSPELFSRVADQASPPVTVERLSKRLRLTPERDGDVVVVEVSGSTKEAAADLANLYATEAVRFTQQLQARAAEEVKGFITPQLAEIEREIFDLKNKERPIPKAVPNAPPSRPSPIQLKVNAAREEVVDSLTRYTETHPVVQAARAKLDALEKQLTNSPPQTVPIAPTEAEVAGQLAVQRDAWELLRSELQPLETARRDMINRRTAAEMLVTEPPGYYRVFAPAELRDVKGDKREIKIGAVTVFMGFVGFMCFALLALLVELLDSRLKAPADVMRVTGLPLIATAPDLSHASQNEQRDWAFRTWTRLQGRLSPSLNHGLVCGVTSAGHGEGRSTWIKLLARAASEAGFRVLTVTARHPGMNVESPKPNGANGANGANHSKPANGNGNGHTVTSINALNTLPSPMEVEDKLVGPQSQPVVHIPLPGWVWNLDRRKQWQSALDRWQKIENVVILVELPPACVPESVLLAQELPNLIWLTDSKKSKASETRAQLDTLRSARCRLVGAVLNHAEEDPFRKRFARWLPCGLLLLACSAANAQLGTNTLVRPDTPVAPAARTATNALITTQPLPPGATTSLSTGPTGPRAAWQQRFTLGPGDVLAIQLYGQPELSKREVIVGPDGRVAFLEANDVVASGLTVDEFRARLDEELGKFRRAARTMVTPIGFKSKKYCVLGKVNYRGVFTIDHPTTILEAVARARGFEVGLRERDSVDLVDLQRSFLMRGGKRISVSFEKMFLDGDFAQNILIEPGDFLFFPAMSLKEIHVIGEVKYPGTVTWTESSSVIAVISQRAGFNEKAYKSRVLVIRGSLENPETFIVDTMDVLNGKTPDFKLQPKDIVFISKRPWWRVEDLLELAINAFGQSVVSSWVGQDLMPPFEQ
jgi:protein involved in polysaccharide export with SLBB domain/capsular polysaccharide biosynthesis protein